jgi:hypothetical protein
MSKEITLDFTDKVIVETQRNMNAIGSLRMLLAGLFEIAVAVRKREVVWAAAFPDTEQFSFGGNIGGNRENQQLIGCFFHWFAVSVVNYANLVGYLRGLKAGAFTFDDLSDRSMFRVIGSSVKSYVDGVPEIAEAKRWRNKVAAHFAIAAPFGDDNIATLELSSMFPVTFENGRYFVGGMTLTRRNSAGTFTSDLPHWSVTQVFESLISRYWPGLILDVPKPPVKPRVDLPPELTRLPDRQYSD